MKRLLGIRIIVVWYVCMAMAWPALAGADEANVPSPASLPVQESLLITEVQTGSADSASEEFIEIYNPTARAVAVSGYRLEVASAAATDWSTPHRTIALGGSIEANGYMVVASSYTAAGASVQYLADSAATWFSAGIAATGGHIRLVQEVHKRQADQSCMPIQAVIDEVEWHAPERVFSSLSNRTPFTTLGAEGIAAGSSLQRRVAVVGGYMDTNNDMADFAVAVPTSGQGAASPGMGRDPLPVPAHNECAAIPEVPPAPPEPPLAPDPAAPVVPPADQGLMAPQISELLPNPAAPAVDADDEYVELYNPNDKPFDLTGFRLKTGANGTYTYTFLEGTLLPSQGFVGFMAKDTKLVLSNSGGKATLLDPFGTVIAESDVYDKAAAGQAWIFADNAWQWTTQPSPGTANVRALPAPPAASRSVARPKTAGAASKKTTTAPKASAVKAAKTAAPAKTAERPAETATKQAASAADQAGPSVLHPGLLAVAGVLAILYGAYEYRHDVANKIRAFRTNRAARSSPGQGPKGR